MKTQPAIRMGGSRERQSGAALVIGLILLLVLTLLAVSGMNTATLELQMTGNQQFSQNAFQAAESGIGRVLEQGSYDTQDPETIAPTSVPGSTDVFTTTTSTNCENGTTPPPGGGFSLGYGVGIFAIHFDIVSTGTSARGATATNTQSFYTIGPGSCS